MRGSMSKNLVPSEIVNFIDQYFPKAGEFQEESDHSDFKVHPTYGGTVSALVGMVSSLDQSLLPAAAPDLADLRLATEHVRLWVASLTSGQGGDVLPKVPGSGRQNAVVMIRRVLQGCSDLPVVPEQLMRLEFVNDPDYRKHLAADLQEIESDLNDGQWKSATVLAGSLMEALLLNVLENTDQNELTKSAHHATLSKGLHWADLYDYLKVAVEIGVLTQKVYDFAIKAKDFRNLIHAGRAKRLQADFSRATALTVRAALEHVIEDLAKRATP